MYSVTIFCLLLGSWTGPSSARNLSRLMVVSFDGFRYDFLDKGLTPTLNSLKSLGAYSRFMVNVFPTQTFTNHFSIATGLYTEVHGVMANHVYNKTSKTEMNYSDDLFHYNNDVTPIWTLNEKAGGGRRSGVMMWAGGEFEYAGVKPTFVNKYDESINWTNRVDMAISWFTNPRTPANLVMVYFEQPDRVEHVYGPDLVQTEGQIRRTDNITKFLLDRLKENGLDDVNVVFLSDHGMGGVKETGIINLSLFTPYKFKEYGSSPVLQIYPEQASEADILYQNLKRSAIEKKTFNIYAPNEIPEHFHYKHCDRVPPILAVAEPGYAFEDLYVKIEKYKKLFNVNSSGTFGVHGYDPDTLEMHPFLLAKGPAFKKNYTPKTSIRNIDLYLLFAHILDLQLPALKPNGTYAKIAEIVASKGCQLWCNIYIILSCIVMVNVYRFK